MQRHKGKSVAIVTRSDSHDNVVLTGNTNVFLSFKTARNRYLLHVYPLVMQTFLCCVLESSAPRRFLSSPDKLVHFHEGSHWPEPLCLLLEWRAQRRVTGQSPQLSHPSVSPHTSDALRTLLAPRRLSSALNLCLVATRDAASLPLHYMESELCLECYVVVSLFSCLHCKCHRCIGSWAYDKSMTAGSVYSV